MVSVPDSGRASPLSNVLSLRPATSDTGSVPANAAIYTANAQATTTNSQLPGAAASLKPPLSGSASIDLWAVAVNKLPSEQKDHLPKNGSEPDALDALLEIAKKKQDECRGRDRVFHFKGRNIVVRDVAEKLVNRINRFKAIGDIVANVDPLHVGIPWAGVRFLLEVSCHRRSSRSSL